MPAPDRSGAGIFFLSSPALSIIISINYRETSLTACCATCSCMLVFQRIEHSALNSPRSIRGKTRVNVPEFLTPTGREEERLLGELDAERLPQHIAVIMDGNGRWARKRHLPRIAGHRAGVRSARTIIETCARLKIPALTLYAFSMENWRRPKAEIDFLMRLLR